MDSSLSAPLLPTSETDIVMDDGDLSNKTPNGFIHPQDTVLSQEQDLDLPDSTPDEEFSREISQPDTEFSTLSSDQRYLKPTGCCYDARMTLHANADFSASPHHPEDPRRIQAIMKEFQDSGLIYTGPESELIPLLKHSPNRWMYRISARNATESEICLVHNSQHFQWVRDLTNKTSSELRNMTNEMDAGRKSLYVGNLTYQAALISAGGAIETCKNVVAGVCKNAIAVIRPPGHHAEANESMGFCIFNNVPIAASVCMQDYPEKCRKVLILDWDVHHGNGIQNMFYENPNVLYISIHVYQNGSFYPGQPDDGGTDGGLDQCGAGKGIGKNVNIGWQEQGMGDSDYMAAFQKIVMPIAQEFDPDLVIISAGFDAAAGDELGGCFVTPACYSQMTHMLMSLAGGKVVACLEGGYNLGAISKSAVAVAKTLMGEPPQRISLAPLQKQAAHVINEVRLQQAPYWECMRQGTVTRKDIVDQGATRLDNVLRKAQRAALSSEFKMVTLYVQRTAISKTFEDQVLATPRLHISKKIVLIIHDPPQLLAVPDPVTGEINPTNAHVLDPVLPYTRQFISHDYGVLDVNIPSHILPETNNHFASNENPAFIMKPSTMFLENQTKELLCYLWDNYLEGYASENIVLMGVGDAYLGVKQLLTSRDCKSKIAGVVSFVSGSLRPVKSETDPQLSSWYKLNSHIYVSPDHACWLDEDAARKVRKNRFGAVIQSEVVGLNAMLRRYLDDTVDHVNQIVDARLAQMSPEDPDETEEEGDLRPSSLNTSAFAKNKVIDLDYEKPSSFPVRR